MAGLLSLMGGGSPSGGSCSVSTGLKHQAWRLLLENDYGRIQHAFVALGEISGPPLGTRPLVDCIAGAVSFSTDTPIGAAESTRFAAGLAVINSGDFPSRLVFDTSDLRPSDLIVFSVNVGGSLELPIRARSILRGENIAGVTKRRLALVLYRADTGSPFFVDTTNIMEKNLIRIDFVGFMR